MQSQQKKVKWSRGETADALQERTDTGITQVSVSKLENIIADIYGNISRRPAFKIISQAHALGDTPVLYQNDMGTEQQPNQNTPYTFVFTVNENKYIIFTVGYNQIVGFLIENEKFVRKVNISGTGYTDIISNPWGNYGNASFAQSNNWGILSNVWNTPMILRLTDTDDITIEPFKFSAPWYAPNGTQTIQVSSNEISGLNFDSSTVGNYTFTESNGITTVYSWISTGISATSISCVWSAATTTYYLTGPSSSSELYISTTPDNYVNCQWTMTNGNTYTSGQTLATATGFIPVPIKITIDSKRAYFGSLGPLQYDVTNNVTLPTIPLAEVIPEGSIVQFPNNGAYMRVEGYASNGTNLMMYGALLTPLANQNTTDTIVKVETGYVSLEEYDPTEYTFSQQRLYATKWTNLQGNQIEIPGYVVGSQIARFNDFKSDYNTKSEAVVIDINTAYQEKVQYVVDYNGVKIFTTDSEYAYSEQNGVAKQSTNGCSANCRPIIFGASLLYVDKSKRQIRALQYELQTDIYQSNVINQMCQQDLIYNPIAMVSKYDKENHTGSFIYVIQHTATTGVFTTPGIAVCNFVPGNQAQIWGRWKVPTLANTMTGQTDIPIVINAVVVNNKPWFVITAYSFIRNHTTGYHQGYTLAELSNDNLLDFEIQADPTDTQYSLCKGLGKNTLYAWTYNTTIVYTEYPNPSGTIFGPRAVEVGDAVYNQQGVQIGTVEGLASAGYSIVYNSETYASDTSKTIRAYDLTIPGATVSVFDGDEYKWDDTLDSEGKYTKSLAQLTNPRVGFMINAELVSHPIDVGGKTYTDHKRIGKCVAVIRDTEPGAFTVCDKTGYTDNDKKTVSFYGCTGMKNELRYTVKNIQGAKFTIESLTMIIEYATLDS